MCRVYEASERATLAHIRKVRATLSEEQKRRFDAMLGKCLCRSCSAHGKHAGCEEGGCR